MFFNYNSYKIMEFKKGLQKKSAELFKRTARSVVQVKKTGRNPRTVDFYLFLYIFKQML